ncbi:MAG TPA: PAS domain S-box protein [Arachidicoccus sp.]|nr:PAS domain S-box protein [Arachidicoccus sp.]
MTRNSDQDLFTLRSILESLEEAIITHDMADKILNSNQLAEQMFDLSRTELYGMSIYNLIPLPLHDEYKEILKRRLDSGSVSHLKTIRLTANGKSLAVSLTISAIKDDNGKIIGVSQIIRECDAERAFEEKQSILAAIIEDSEDAIISKTLQGYITSWNKGAEQIFGYTKEEVIGKHINLLIPSERVREEDMILNRIREGNKMTHFETIRLTKSGNEIPISLTASPVKDKRGQIMGISKIARNISYKKISEERQAILAAIVENSDDAIISKTVDGLITSWNRGAEKIFGYKEQEVIGQNISIIIPSDRIDEETVILKNIRSGVTVDHFQTVRLRKGGMPLDISLSVSPIKDSAGRIIGASKIARDITFEKLAQSILKERNKRKDEFIAMASHELKTPLTSMSGYLQLLEIKVPDEDKVFVKRIIRQQERLNNLFNDLFDISKIQAGKLKFSFENFDMTQLILEVIDSFRNANPDFRFQVDLQENLLIEGDSIRLEQVITNLLANAVKYSPNGGNVEVRATIHAEELIFSIRDQGLGIASEHLREIFNQYYRAEQIDTKIAGLGLGLYISKEIIERHGGRIWAESSLGEGSKFTVILPTSQK